MSGFPALRRGDNLWTKTTLLAEQVLTANVTEIAAGFGWSSAAMLLLSVSAAASTSGDKLDVYVDVSPDGGTTWANLLRFPQVLGNGGAKQFWAFVAPSTGETTTFDVTTDAAAGVVRQLGVADHLRVRAVVTNGSGSASFTAHVAGEFKG